MGKPRPAQLMSVIIRHHCPREQDSAGNFPVLGHFVEVRGRDEVSAIEAWNTRSAPSNRPYEPGPFDWD
jgi:hypothetical protein